LSAALWLAACDSGNPHTPTVDELREFVLTGPAPEESGGDLLGESHHSHRELLDQLADVVKQPKVKGVFLRSSGFAGAWARSAELHDALQRVRDAKKPVHCYADGLDNAGYALLASSCDRITMAPTGMLALTGLSAQVVYARELLDTIGVRAELLQVGRFKGAADALTRSDMPAEVRQTLGALLDDLQATLAAAVMKGRSIDAAAFARAVDAGPHTAKAALEQHLIDAVAFDDEAREKAKQASAAKRVSRVLHGPNGEHVDIFDVFKALWGGEHEKAHGERIALAYLEGEIRDDEREQGRGASSGPFITNMRRIADDKDVRALVLRIDSPGGSALASDKMWHAVRRVAHRKPVIVSVGDMAASGGYYVACAGTEIFAQDSSVVGSIGVVGGKVVVEPLADRLGVRMTHLTRGRNAGWSSVFTPFSDTERAAILAAMNDTYATFLARVHEGRKLEGDKLTSVAEGRIMSGKRAREGGLVDSAGGLMQALARARSKGAVPDDAPIEVWPKERSLFERASQLLGGASAPSSLQDSLLALPQLARSPLALSLVRGDMRPLTALPYALELN
jgi:protease-4